jgi:hypothetical protein
MDRIIITVEGGLIQDIKNIPFGTVIEVRDYDTDWDEDKDLKEDEKGDKYTCVEWVGEDLI